VTGRFRWDGLAIIAQRAALAARRWLEATGVRPAAAFDKALALITRCARRAGRDARRGGGRIVVAEQLMEGIKGPAVSALAASLTARLRRAMEAAGRGRGLFWHLQAEQGALLVVPTPGARWWSSGEPDVNVGLVRLELLGRRRWWDDDGARSRRGRSSRGQVREGSRRAGSCWS